MIRRLLATLAQCRDLPRRHADLRQRHAELLTASREAVEAYRAIFPRPGTCWNRRDGQALDRLAALITKAREAEATR